MQHALTALDLGRTGKTAVEIACRRDSCSGGKIRTFNLIDWYTPGEGRAPKLNPGEVIMIEGSKNDPEYRSKGKR